MPGVEIGRYSRIRRAIINTGVKIPGIAAPSASIRTPTGRTGYHVTEGGITVVA